MSHDFWFSFQIYENKKCFALAQISTQIWNACEYMCILQVR